MAADCKLVASRCHFRTGPESSIYLHSLPVQVMSQIRCMALRLCMVHRIATHLLNWLAG